MLTTIIVCLILALLSLAASLYFNYKHGILIIQLIDEIEFALNVMDEKEQSISKILEIPLFYDSPQIRQVHKDIASCRDSILKVATTLATVDDMEQVEVEVAT
jgi:hypothetical protein